MKNSPLIGIMIGVLVVSGIVSVALSAGYVAASRQLRSLQSQAVSINGNRTVLNNLALEALEYSKKNPAINPILENAGIKPKSEAAPAGAAKSK